MTSDNYTKGIYSHSLSDHIRQLILLIGVGFEDMFDSEALQYRTNRDCFSRLVKISAGTGMVLMPGHGGSSVFHEYQGQVVFVKQGVNNPWNPGMKEG